VNNKIDTGCLPKITKDIFYDFLDERFIDTDSHLHNDDASWSQEAVDFACLVTGNLMEIIEQQKKEIKKYEIQENSKL
jgi:hypothetical protein